MKTLILILMIGSLFGQNLPTQSAIEKMTITEKMMLYNLEKKSPSTAALWEFIIPTAGYIYVDRGKWEDGFMHRIVELIAILAASNHDYVNHQNTFFNSSILGGIAVFIHFYEFYNVNKLTTNYNNNLYRNIYGKEPNISLKLQPTYEGANLTMSYALN